jgi:peptidyl-prolyl cis-trans isomerase D
MISWIQTYFQKHFRAVFAVLLFLMIASLVAIYNPASGIGRASQQTLERPFFGHNLGNENDVRRLNADAVRSAQLNGMFQVNEQQLEQYMLYRTAGLAIADQLHLPQPTEKETAAYITTLAVFKDQQGNFDQKRYSAFADSLKTNPQFTTADANRVLRDDARLAALGELMSGPGYVLPIEVRTLLTRSDTKWTLEVASWDYASFNPDIPVTDDVLKKFYDENSFRYEVGPRVKLRAVDFKAAEFAPAATPTEEQLRAYYNANRARFPAPVEPAKTDAKSPALTVNAGKPATDDFPKVRAQVEAAMRQEAGMQAALKVASDFTVALYESKAKANSPELTSFLAAQKRTATSLAPFGVDAPPAGLAWLGNYAEQIERLNQDRYFSDPLPAPDGSVVVLLWDETLPGYKPLLPEVREKVAADYRAEEKRKRFLEQGWALRARLEATVKAGTPFAKAAAAEKLEVKSYVNLTAQNPAQDFPREALNALQNLDTGKVANMIPTAEKGYFVYADQRQLPDLTPANPRYAQISAQLASFNSGMNQRMMLNELVTAELKKSAPAERTR